MSVPTNEPGAVAQFWMRKAVLLFYLLAASLVVALLLLGGFHLYLIMTNQTTIEFYTRSRWSDGSPYSIDALENIRSFFGVDGQSKNWRRRWWCALLPVTTTPLGDGYNYARINNAVPV